MMDNTIAELTKAREAACRGEPLGWSSIGDITACWLKYKLGICIDQPAVWTGGTWDRRTVAEVIRRLGRPRDLLAGDQLTYSCVTNCGESVNARSWAALEGPDGQPVCNPGTPALLIELCPHSGPRGWRPTARRPSSTRRRTSRTAASRREARG